MTITLTPMFSTTNTTLGLSESNISETTVVTVGTVTPTDGSVCSLSPLSQRFLEVGSDFFIVDVIKKNDIQQMMEYQAASRKYLAYTQKIKRIVVCDEAPLPEGIYSSNGYETAVVQFRGRTLLAIITGSMPSYWNLVMCKSCMYGKNCSPLPQILKSFVTLISRLWFEEDVEVLERLEQKLYIDNEEQYMEHVRGLGKHARGRPQFPKGTEFSPEMQKWHESMIREFERMRVRKHFDKIFPILHKKEDRDLPLQTIDKRTKKAKKKLFKQFLNRCKKDTRCSNFVERTVDMEGICDWFGCRRRMRRMLGDEIQMELQRRLAEMRANPEEHKETTTGRVVSTLDKLTKVQQSVEAWITKFSDVQTDIQSRIGRLIVTITILVDPEVPSRVKVAHIASHLPGHIGNLAALVAGMANIYALGRKYMREREPTNSKNSIHHVHSFSNMSSEGFADMCKENAEATIEGSDGVMSGMWRLCTNILGFKGMPELSEEESKAFKGMHVATSAIRDLSTLTGWVIKIAEWIGRKVFSLVTGHPWLPTELEGQYERLQDWEKHYVRYFNLNRVRYQDALDFIKVHDEIFLDLKRSMLMVKDNVVLRTYWSNLEAKTLSLFLEMKKITQCPGERDAPVAFLLCGDTQQGKTTVTDLTATQLADDVGIVYSAVSDLKYTVSKNEEYFTGYRGQFMTVYDELFMSTDKERLEKDSRTIVDLVNVGACPLPMASIPEKGRYFVSDVFMATSNLGSRSGMVDGVPNTIPIPPYILEEFVNAKAVLGRFGRNVFWFKKIKNVTDEQLAADPELANVAWEIYRYEVKGDTCRNLVLQRSEDLPMNVGEMINSLSEQLKTRGTGLRKVMTSDDFRTKFRSIRQRQLVPVISSVPSFSSTIVTTSPQGLKNWKGWFWRDAHTQDNVTIEFAELMDDLTPMPLQRKIKLSDFSEFPLKDAISVYVLSALRIAPGDPAVEKWCSFVRRASFYPISLLGEGIAAYINIKQAVLVFLAHMDDEEMGKELQASLPDLWNLSFASGRHSVQETFVEWNLMYCKGEVQEHVQNILNGLSEDYVSGRPQSLEGVWHLTKKRCMAIWKDLFRCSSMEGVQLFIRKHQAFSISTGIFLGAIVAMTGYKAYKAIFKSAETIIQEVQGLPGAYPSAKGVKRRVPGRRPTTNPIRKAGIAGKTLVQSGNGGVTSQDPTHRHILCLRLFDGDEEYSKIFGMFVKDRVIQYPCHFYEECFEFDDLDAPNSGYSLKDEERLGHKVQITTCNGVAHCTLKEMLEHSFLDMGTDFCMTDLDWLSRKETDNVNYSHVIQPPTYRVHMFMEEHEVDPSLVTYQEAYLIKFQPTAEKILPERNYFPMVPQKTANVVPNGYVVDDLGNVFTDEDMQVSVPFVWETWRGHYGKLYCGRAMVMRMMSGTTAPGDCGLPYVAPKKMHCILGMHLGRWSGERDVYLRIVTQDDIAQGLVALGHVMPKRSAKEVVSNESQQEVEGILRQCHPKVDVVGIVEQSSNANVSAFVKGPLHPDNNEISLQLFGESAFETAHLKRFWRNGERVSPMALALSEMAPRPSDVTMHEVRRAAVGLHHQWPPRPGLRPYVLSVKEAIVGIDGTDYKAIDKNTSMGYKFKVLYPDFGDQLAKGKHRFLRIEETTQGKKLYFVRDLAGFSPLEFEYLSTAKLMSQGKSVCPIAEDILKDETLPKKKVSEGRTRIFSTLPFDWQLVLRQVFMCLQVTMNGNLRNAEAKLGINPYSTDWEDLYRYLKRFNNCFAGDYKNFDKNHLLQFMRCAFDVIENWFKEYGYHDEMFWLSVERMYGQWATMGKRYDIDFPVLETRDQYKELFENILTSARRDCERCLHVAMGVMYMVVGILASGLLLTAVLNCIINSLIHRVSAYRRIPKLNGNPTLRFEDHASLAVVGDDNVVTVDDLLKDYHNCITMTEEVAKMGMIYTDYRKDVANEALHDIHAIEFNKRTFVVDGSRIRGPLRWSSVIEMLFWQNKQFNALYAIRQNLRCVSIELHQYSFEEYNSIKMKLEALLRHTFPDEFRELMDLIEPYPRFERTVESCAHEFANHAHLCTCAMHKYTYDDMDFHEEDNFLNSEATSLK